MHKRKNSGLSLVELMVSITVAMIISIGALYVYSGQLRTFFQTARKEQTTQEAAAAFEIISSLLRQAEICLSCSPQQTVAMTYPTGISNPNATTTLQAANDSIQVDFTVPSGYSIWPNDSTPYTNNAIRLEWSAASGILYVSAGASVTDTSSSRTLIPLAGNSGNLNTRVINFDVWPMVVDAAGAVATGAAGDKPTAGYRIVLTSRVGAPDATYTNPLDPTGALKNYRTVTYESTVLSRNW